MGGGGCKGRRRRKGGVPGGDPLPQPCLGNKVAPKAVAACAALSLPPSYGASPILDLAAAKRGEFPSLPTPEPWMLPLPSSFLPSLFFFWRRGGVGGSLRPFPFPRFPGDASAFHARGKAPPQPPPARRSSFSSPWRAQGRTPRPARPRRARKASVVVGGEAAEALSSPGKSGDAGGRTPAEREEENR